MGSLFSSTVPRYSPVSYVPTSPNSKQKQPSRTVNTEAVAQEGNSQDAAEEESIKDIIRRNARGRNSLIQTSYRGVLTDINSLSPQRKNLLGE